MTRDPTSDRYAHEAMREEAATWFVRMREPFDSDEVRAFERWLASDPRHRAAYNRIGEAWTLGRRLGGGPTRPRPTAVPPRPATSRAPLAVFATLLLCFALWSMPRLFTAVHGQLGTAPAAAPAARQYATTVGEIRNFRLADGSRITLDTHSRVAVDFSSERRSLRLLEGRARFDVAHETRPFVVDAGAGAVTAHGTLFDVVLSPDDHVVVRLLRGAIDVALPPSGPSFGDVPVRHLGPGEQVEIARETITVPARTAAATDVRWPDGMLDCDDMPLGEVIARADRYSPGAIAVADPALGRLRVSGSFRIDRPQVLGAQLARLFDLDARPAGAGRILLAASARQTEFSRPLS